MKKRNLLFTVCALLLLAALIVTTRYWTRGNLSPSGERDTKDLWIRMEGLLRVTRVFEASIL